MDASPGHVQRSLFAFHCRICFATFCVLGECPDALEAKGAEAGMNSFQWDMRAPAPPANPNRGGGGFRFNAPPLGPLMEPGVYMIRLIASGQTLSSSVQVPEDTCMRPQ